MHEHQPFSKTETWTLVATVVASSMVFIDSTALNVVLPALQNDLGVTGTELLWIVNAYALFLSALLLLGGALGDIYGRNRIFLLGLIIFSISSFACGISESPLQLIYARGFQGVGGALLTPGSLSILNAQFDVNKRGKAIGIWSTFSALTAVIGPVLGGWLASQGLWRVIFFINIPLSLLILLVMALKVPESKNEEAKRLDVLGSVLITLSLLGLTYGLIESPKLGFRSSEVIFSIIGGLSFFTLFLLSQYKIRFPLMPLSLFKSKDFSGANLLTLFVYGALGGGMFFIPLNLVQVQGYSEEQVGVALLPMILCISVLSPISGKMVDGFGSKKLLILGPIITGVGFFLFTRIGITSGIENYFTSFFPAFVLLGIGMGITVAPLTTTVMASVSKNSSGLASGINNTVSRAAGVLAVALMGAFSIIVFKNEMSSKIKDWDITNVQKKELILESQKMAGAQPPDGLSPEVEDEIRVSIKRSFLTAFNRINLITAAMVWLAAFVAYFLIGNKNQQSSV